MKGLSRRNLLGFSVAGATGSAALLLGACGDEGSEPSVEDQAEALNDALALELRAVATYAAAPRFLSGDPLETMERFAAQEREHVDALGRAIEELGATPVEPESERAHRDELSLTELEAEDDFLNFAVDLENAAIAVFGSAANRVASPELRRTLFSVIATEAEHLSVLLGELSEPQVPDAFVFGTQAGVRGL